MTYVYREAGRMARRPVHASAPPAPASAPLKPLPPKKSPPALPPPVWGGRLGLDLASAEVSDWEQRHPRHNPPERRDS